MGTRGRVKSILLHLWCGPGNLDRWRLESEGLRLSNLTCICVLDLVALASFRGRVGIDVHWVAWRWAPAAGARRHGAEARSVGRGLRAQLSEIQVGAGAVTHGHGFAELALGPETVEDDAVDGDDENLDYDFDDAAYKCPVLVECQSLGFFVEKWVVSAYLKTADEAVGHVVLEEMSSLVVNTGPAPHVFVVVLRFTLVEDGSTDTPHDDAEYEECNSKDSVVSGNLFGSMVTSSPVGDDDEDGHD